MKLPQLNSRTAFFILLLCASTTNEVTTSATESETLPEITAFLAKETAQAYDACKFSALSKDYFSRFSRDSTAAPAAGEILIDANWRLIVPTGTDPLGRRMVEHLQTFLRERMNLDLPIEQQSLDSLAQLNASAIVFLDSGGGDANAPESFTINVRQDRVTVQGDSPNALRDGIVRLVDRIGFREAPILEPGSITYKPRLAVRLGAIPTGGSCKDLIFFGSNAIHQSFGDLYALSESNAIPELAVRRVPGMLKSHRQQMKEFGQYGVKVYALLNTRQKFPKDDPVFLAHPKIRGSLTWSADGEYTLCTSHPLVRQYLKESIQGLFKALPELHGVTLIIGGEGFYHCHMRPFGVEKGHTNCTRCEPLGAEAAVADLCNDLAAAARIVNPNAEVVLWPYSAEHVWAADRAAAAMIEKLKPGLALLTEVEKSEVIAKPHGVQKSIWDYSIDFIGPGVRTKEQIAVCNKHNIPIYLKSEPELGFEAPRLPQIPCMDRWADRAEALTSRGANGAWIFPFFRHFYGTSTAEINKFVCWTPVSDREQLLLALAKRIAGEPAAGDLREAWRAVSAAIPCSPELPAYYTGPYYLGPLHPMCADRAAALPDVFYGQYLYRAEHKDSEGLKKRPTFYIDPSGNIPIFAAFYRDMEQHLAHAAAKINSASPRVDDRHRLTFDAEASPILWFYHTARTHANFYESCQLRDALAALLKKGTLTKQEKTDAAAKLTRWQTVLKDELENTKQALPLIQQDMRLDPYYGDDHTFPHGEQMIDAKLVILQSEIAEYLPSLEARFAQK